MDSVTSLLWQDVAVLALGGIAVGSWMVIWRCHLAAQAPRVTLAADAWFPVRGRWLLYATMVACTIMSIPAMLLFILGLVSVNVQLLMKLTGQH